jgi:hypothetical protein
VRHPFELGRHCRADVRVIVAMARRPPRSDAVDQSAAVGEMDPNPVRTFDDVRPRRSLHLPIR